MAKAACCSTRQAEASMSMWPPTSHPPGPGESHRAGARHRWPELRMPNWRAAEETQLC